MVQRRPLRPPVARLRAALLAALLLTVTGVAVLFFFGRAGRPPDEAIEEADLETGRGLLLRGEGFDYQVTRGEEPIFRVRADRIVSERQDHYALEGVALTFFRPDGSRYRLASARGSYDVEAQEADLEGEVLLEGPRELELRAEGLQLRDQGQLLVSTSPVSFRLRDGTAGRADRLRANLRRDLFVLIGDIAVQATSDQGPVSLSCQRLSYQRDRREVRAEEEVSLIRGTDMVRGERFVVLLSEDESRALFVRGRFGVAARSERTELDGRKSRIEARGDALSLILDETEARPRKLELEGGETGRPVLESHDGAGLVRRLTGSYVVAGFDAGELRTAEALGPVEITEFFAFDPGTLVRRALAQRAHATFGGSEQQALGLTRLRLEEDVELREPDLVAEGREARLDLVEGRLELEGDAMVEVDQGRVQAPVIEYLRDEELLVARGGVRAILEQGGPGRLAGSPLGGGEGPVHVESREAFWKESMRTFLFRGEVRAWRGENVLLARELRGEAGEAGEEWLRAEGGVKTVWESGGTEREGGALEVTAERLDYSDRERRLTYLGGARARQAGRLIACPRMEARLGTEGRVEVVTCEEGVRIEDPATGQTVEGDRALYRVAQAEVEVTGDPVTLRDGQGAQVKGRRLLYDVAAGSAQMMSAPEAAGVEPGG